MDIRPARASDLDAIRACAEAAYAPYVDRIGRKPAPMIADFGAYISAGQVHVAVSETGVLGYIIFFMREDAMFLENVAVLPEAHGRGVGRALIAFCEAEARSAGAQRVALYTNAKMVENLALYPRLGYRELDRRCEDGFDRVFFEKQL
ncbi:MAG: GNAT family N-acetyltransferase [Litoreibacter sp.]|nr:GNAT family N-acetyltransferase [Litoreibacter sp.]